MKFNRPRIVMVLAVYTAWLLMTPFALVSCAYTDKYVNQSAVTKISASIPDFTGIWINAIHFSDSGRQIFIYKLDANGTGQLVYRCDRRGIGEYSVAWRQIQPGIISLEHKRTKGGVSTPGEFTGKYSATARLTDEGLEMKFINVTFQFYRPESPRFANMVADMQREMHEGGDANAFGQLLGQVASAALSGGVNTLVDNPHAALSEVRYEAAKGALEGVQEGLQQ